MSEPFLGEIRTVSFAFAPQGWALCDGQLLPINQNQALFSLLGTVYGGDGVTSFALPDLRGRAPMHWQSGGPGGRGGLESVALTASEVPSHTHTLQVSSARASLDDPLNAYWAADASTARYASAAPDGTMNAASVTPSGGGQPHPNMQPYLVLNFVIALQGIFPSRT